jgi:hypothetical protein
LNRPNFSRATDGRRSANGARCRAAGRAWFLVRLAQQAAPEVVARTDAYSPLAAVSADRSRDSPRSRMAGRLLICKAFGRFASTKPPVEAHGKSNGAEPLPPHLQWLPTAPEWLPDAIEASVALDRCKVWRLRIAMPTWRVARWKRLRVIYDGPTVVKVVGLCAPSS